MVLAPFVCIFVEAKHKGAGEEKRKGGIERYLKLTIGLLQSASMSSRWPPSVSAEHKKKDEK